MTRTVSSGRVKVENRRISLGFVVLFREKKAGEVDELEKYSEDAVCLCGVSGPSGDSDSGREMSVVSLL